MLIDKPPTSCSLRADHSKPSSVFKYSANLSRNSLTLIKVVRVRPDLWVYHLVNGSRHLHILTR